VNLKRECLISIGFIFIHKCLFIKLQFNSAYRKSKNILPNDVLIVQQFFYYIIFARRKNIFLFDL
jgi:hypothetical protein